MCIRDRNKIALDLREAHKDDFFSGPEDNPLEDFLQTAEETASPDKMCIRDSLCAHANSSTISPLDKNRFNVFFVFQFVNILFSITAFANIVYQH